MKTLTTTEQLQIFNKYIGQPVIIRSLTGSYEDRVGILTGVKENGVQVKIAGSSQWVPVYEDFPAWEIKLLLKPLKALTADIVETANRLPIQNFITQYYTSLGFDMPVFLSPDHPLNCSYVRELGLAEYIPIEQIEQPSYRNAVEMKVIR
jgi:hypothetical protein